MAEPAALAGKIERLLSHHNPLRTGMGLAPVSADTIQAQLQSVAPRVLPYIDTVLTFSTAERREGKRILFEGAQDTCRRQPRNLSIRHLIEHGCGASGHGFGPRARRNQLCAGNLQGLYDQGGRGALSHRAAQRSRPAHRRPRARIWYRDRPPSEMRVVRRRAGKADRSDQRS